MTTTPATGCPPPSFTCTTGCTAGIEHLAGQRRRRRVGRDRDARGRAAHGDRRRGHLDVARGGELEGVTRRRAGERQVGERRGTGVVGAAGDRAAERPGAAVDRGGDRHAALGLVGARAVLELNDRLGGQRHAALRRGDGAVLMASVAVVPSVAVAVKVTGEPCRPDTAAAVVCWPAVAPSVRVADALPSDPVSVESGATVPSSARPLDGDALDGVAVVVRHQHDQRVRDRGADRSGLPVAADHLDGRGVRGLADVPAAALDGDGGDEDGQRAASFSLRSRIMITLGRPDARATADCEDTGARQPHEEADSTPSGHRARHCMSLQQCT